jgi:hypothetical protein
MSRLILMVVVLVVAAGVAFVLRRRQQPAAPTQPRAWPVPVQLDRNDFARPDAPFLVAVFTSETCGNCERVVQKARVVETAEVAYDEISYQADKARHERYSIEAVPMVLIADAHGIVQKSFVGEVTAIDLWGELATVRDPSSRPAPSEHHHDHSAGHDH